MKRIRQDSEQTRSAILDAAELLFTQKGIATTTLEAISRAAGVTRGAFYWHFKDKSDLLVALCERHRLPQQSLLSLAAEQGHDDPLGLLETSGIEVQAIFEADEGQQRLFRILSNHGEDPEVSARIREHNENLSNLMCRLAELARQKGMLNSTFSPDEAAILTLATMNGLLAEWLRSDRGFPLAALGRKILSAQIDVLRAKHND